MQIYKLLLILIIPIFFSACCAYSAFPGGSYQCAKEDFKGLVQDGRYEEAFKMIDPKGLKSSTYDSQISYDILNVLVNGKKVKKEDLYIYETYKKYPNSIAWTMLSAKILIIYMDTGKLDQETIAIFEKYVPKHSKHNYYWLKALNDLKLINYNQ